MDRKLKLIAVVVALLMSTSLLSTCAAARRPTADSTLGATGGCVVVGDLINYQAVGFTGTGTLNLGATTGVQVVPTDESYPGTLYQSAWFFRLTQQQFTVAWEGHSVSLRFMPKDSHSAMFAKDYQYIGGEPQDYVYFGNTYYAPVTPLIFRGTYTDASGTHSVSGVALAYSDVLAVGPSVGIYVEVWLYNSNGSGFLDIVWVSMTTDIDYDETTITAPAANQIVSQIILHT